ncbi:MAG: CHASE2 domain-containing protein [Cyanobacteria bacterium J06606_4]
MFSKLKCRVHIGHQIAAVGVSAIGILSLATFTGAFEAFELGFLDQFFRLSAKKDLVNAHILVVTIDESDISNAGHWPISDGMLSEVVEKIIVHEPTVVGLDLYRNLQIEPGSAQLTKTFETYANVFGVEKVAGQPVAPHGRLASLDQTAAADVLVDTDGRVRRGLLSLRSHDDKVKPGLATALALESLAQRNIFPEVLDGEGLLLQVGKTKIRRFEKNDGGYVNADHRGFQVLMNYQADYHQFETVSMTAVLNGELTDEQVRDRIVLVGSTAISLNDLFYTPFDRSEQVAGVFLHAHLTSQLIHAALEGKPFLRTVPDYLEWLWTGVWVGICLSVNHAILYSKSLKSELQPWQILIRLGGIWFGIGAAGYCCLLAGWWLPIAIPLTSVLLTTGIGIGYRNAQLQNLAAFDELTQVANRRYFDQHLANALRQNKQLSLILCDVDYFKAYNDLYGHPAGDDCLRKVAQGIKSTVRSEDLVARYGGEEFVIVLTDTTEEMASSATERIQNHIRGLSIPHEGSQVNSCVTLSFGLASSSRHYSTAPSELIDYADKALYEAKQAGRDRLVVSNWQDLKDRDTDGLSHEEAA